MIRQQNIHSHTVYCDGKATPEEMVLGAIEKECDSLGFSGHAHADFDAKHSMSAEGAREYINEIRRLKEKYEGKIELFLGVEQEYYTEPAEGSYDFILGAVHFIKKGDQLVCVDNGPNRQRAAADNYFGGDYNAMAEVYFQTVAAAIIHTKADVVAHYDLITKYNFGGSLFDETHPRYVSSALDAMDEILKSCRLFEINTGAMYRFDKPEPYPSVFLLKELRQRGGEVIISSDSHNTESICWKYGEMLELARHCGFKYIKRLTKDGFADMPL